MGTITRAFRPASVEEDMTIEWGSCSVCNLELNASTCRARWQNPDVTLCLDCFALWAMHCGVPRPSPEWIKTTREDFADLDSNTPPNTPATA